MRYFGYFSRNSSWNFSCNLLFFTFNLICELLFSLSISVKSYGTEDRETQFPIAPQNQCYDYILFRGSDIKDIRVINNNPVPNDPAIMQMHLPPQQQLPPPLQNKLGQAGFQPQPGGFMMPPIGGPGGPPMGGPPPGHTPMGAPYSSFGGINNLGGMLSSANELVSKSPFPPSGGGGGPQAVNQMQQQQQQQANQQSQQSSGGNNELGNFLVGTSSSDQQSSSGTAAGTTTGGAGRIGSSPEVNNIDGAVVAEHRDQGGRPHGMCDAAAFYFIWAVFTHRRVCCFLLGLFYCSLSLFFYLFIMFIHIFGFIYSQ